MTELIPAICGGLRNLCGPVAGRVMYARQKYLGECSGVLFVILIISIPRSSVNVRISSNWKRPEKTIPVYHKVGVIHFRPMTQ